MSTPDCATNILDTDVLRLFIGIACPDLNKVTSLLQELQQIALNPHAGVRVVPEANLHITLKFLGSAQRSSIQQIAATLDRLAIEAKPFVMTLVGAGAFRDALWLGVDSSDALTRLASFINQQLEPIGFRSENRPFIPHLTLARLKHQAGPDLQAWLRQHQHETWGRVHVQGMHLYQSETLLYWRQIFNPAYNNIHALRLKNKRRTSQKIRLTDIPIYWNIFPL